MSTFVINKSAPPYLVILDKIIFFILTPNRHHQCPGHHHQKPDESLSAQTFFENNIRENNRHDNAQLVNRDHDADNTVLNRIIVTQPGSPGCNPGKRYEGKLFPVNLSGLCLLALHKYNQPRHQLYNNGADGSSQIGFHPVNSDFGKD